MNVAPTFTIKVNGHDVPLVVRSDTVNVTATFQLEGTDTIDLTVMDPSLEYLDVNIFQEGNRVDLWMGYNNNIEYMLSGEITEFNPTYANNNTPSLQIRCEDLLHRMQADRKRKRGRRKRTGKTKSKTTVGISGKTHKRATTKGATDGDKKAGRTSRVYSGMKDSDIVKAIFRRYGMLADIDSTELKRSRIHQKSLSDFAFLKKLAHINSCFFWVDYDPERGKWVGHLKKRSKLKHESVTLYTYGGSIPSLLYFDPEIIFKNQATNIDILTIDRVSKKPVQVKIIQKGKKTSIEEPKYVNGNVIYLEEEFVSGTKITLKVFGQNIEVITNKTFKNKKSAKIWAEAFARKNSDMFITGSATVVGNQLLKARSLVYFNGLNKRMNGIYEVVEATHKMSASSPYTTDLKVRKYIPPVGVFNKSSSKGPRKHGGDGIIRVPIPLSVILPVLDIVPHGLGLEIDLNDKSILKSTRLISSFSDPPVGLGTKFLTLGLSSKSIKKGIKTLFPIGKQ